MDPILKILQTILPKDIIDNEILSFYNPYKEYFTVICYELRFHVNMQFPILASTKGKGPCCYCPYKGCHIGHEYHDSPYCDRHIKRDRNIGNSLLVPSFVRDPIIPYFS